MSDSKLGLHICNWNYEAEKFAECQPAVMKSIDHNPDRLAAFRATSPGTLWIGRVYMDDEGFDKPKADAERVANVIMSGVKGCRYNVLEGINEPDIGEDEEKAKKLCEFNIVLARRLRAEGYLYAAYSFAATRPHTPLAPHLGAALLESDYLAMHAYGPGPLFHEEYWYLFAYRLFWEALSDEVKRSLGGILLTELGIAKGLLWTQKDKGWKYDKEGPKIEAKAYESDLIEADKRLDHYIKGGTIFQTGDMSARWQSFEAKEVLSGIERHIKSSNNGGQGGNVEIPEWLIDVRDSLEKHPTKKYERRSLEQIDTIVVHHTATTSATPEAIANWHVNNNGWPGAAYHIYARKNGEVYLMNDLEAISYHCYKHNDHAIGIGFEGDFTRESPTQQEIEMGKDIVAWVESMIEITAVRGHKNMPDNSTACPGEFPVAALWSGEPQEDPWQKKYEKLRNAAVAARNTLDAGLKNET